MKKTNKVYACGQMHKIILFDVYFLIRSMEMLQLDKMLPFIYLL